MAAHESLTSFRRTTSASNRKFGTTVGLILIAAALWPVLRHGQPVRLWLLVVGLLLAGFGVAAPRVLTPLNRLWLRFGLLLATLTNPIVMGVLYVCAIGPVALILRLRKRDLLLLRLDPRAATYWIERGADQPGPLTRQF